MDAEPVAGPSGLGNNLAQHEDESSINDAAISQLLQQDLLEEELSTMKSKNNNISDDDEPEEYDVEDIRAKRKNARTGMLEYLVKWSNYPESQNTWEPIDNLKCPELIARFNEAEKNKQRKRRNTNDSPQPTPVQQKRTRIKFTPGQSMVAGDAVINAANQQQQQQQPSVSTVKTINLANAIPKANNETGRIVTPEPQAQRKQNHHQQRQQKQQIDEPLLLEDFEQDGASTESSGGSSLSGARDNNGVDYGDQRARNFLLKGFDRRLPLERIIAPLVDDQNHLWFYVKWKNLIEPEIIDYKDLEEKAPRELCVWYRERLYFDIEKHGTKQAELSESK